MILLALFITMIQLILLITLLSNVLAFPRLGSARFKHRGKPDQLETPRISILIPARNEAAVIAPTIRSLLGQTYQNLELILLDDQSTDGTAEVATLASAGDARLKIIHGMALPKGWTGKNWACHQLSQAAQSDWLIFIDSDVRWEAGALDAVIALMSASKADLLTVWSTQVTTSWAERVVVPLMTMVIMGYLPILMVHYSPFAAFAAANGQCLCFRRRAYEAVGGHAAVAADVVEDVALARRIKAGGWRLRMADGNRLISCRMYQNWPQVRDGFGKNILGGHGDSIAVLAASTVFHWVVFIGPWVWLAVGWIEPSSGWSVWPLLLVIGGLTLRAISAWFAHHRLLDALTLPLGVLLMTRIAIRAVQWRGKFGGPVWKDRVIEQS